MSKPETKQVDVPSNQQTILIKTSPAGGFGFGAKLLLTFLFLSIMVNVIFYSKYKEYFSLAESPPEKYYSGDKGANNKIAVIKMSGTIMPPFTKRLIESIEHATKDDDVKGVLLVVNSPGGFVADSHQIYHRLEELREKKPVYVAMESLAASGGYYIAMGAGPEARIFAEPTTWTGSIGVIIPRYNFSKLAEKIGVSSEPLKTGEFKDSLNPFRDLSENDKKLWGDIMEDSFSRFRKVISDNRSNLTPEQVKELATGQIYTANQALKNGLIDEIGFEEDALNALKEKITEKTSISTFRVITYVHQPGLIELVTGSVKAQEPQQQFSALMEMTVPRAMYYSSWLPVTPPMIGKDN